MLDLHTSQPAPKIIYRGDYSAPDWLVPEVSLVFMLDAAATRVKAKLSVKRCGDHSRPLRLDGDGLTPVIVRIDGAESDGWTLDNGDLVIHLDNDHHIIETEVDIAPAANTSLMGLYASGGLLCSQCEAEGFRRITFFPDRPDVLSRYTVRLEGDKALYPVLLSNGDLVGEGSLGNGCHFAMWNDPFPKPSYLFAVVAGDLTPNRDQFTTMSGRHVDLAIWVAQDDVPKTAHAMTALKASMKWDEDVYGREYDLAVFNIVAVADFNFGAMENKGLNVFNSRYILADPDTATDLDYDGIAAVVAHEYFHNWSGNRVTCRDWFQLSLKEGFTVFRDQCFSADQGSAAVKRIEDVRTLRASQFPEDNGPLAHPIRPESYMEIGNFYTPTIYNKGAEVIRMLHTIVGADAFRKATDLYFDRHDGQAATCENFVQAIEDATGADLRRFRLWYSQAGTPKVTVTLSHDVSTGSATLRITQHVPDTPGQVDKQPMPLPIKFALFDPDTGQSRGEAMTVFDSDEAELTFEGFATAPILSFNRSFSAPIIVETNRSVADLAFLSRRDDDPFARYEAMQQVMIDTLVATVAGQTVSHQAVIDAVRDTVNDPRLDPAFVAEVVLLPSEAFIGEQMLVVDPDTIHAAREALRASIGQALESDWRGIYADQKAATFVYSPAAKGRRRIRSVALGYIAATGAPDIGALAFAQFESANNMTDRQSALGTLVNSDADERTAALDIFYNRYCENALVIDKWFTLQAQSSRSDTTEIVTDLLQHRDFTLHNPNRIRALIGAFAGNQCSFHDDRGRGYAILADTVIGLDKINPQTAAKLTPPLCRWRRFDAKRQKLMRDQLMRIVETPRLSKDVYEQASKSLDH